MNDGVFCVDHHLLASKEIATVLPHDSITEKRKSQVQLLAFAVFVTIFVVTTANLFSLCLLDNVYPRWTFLHNSTAKKDFVDYSIGYDQNKERRLPQCVIIGVRKGGTRALLRFLSLHPDIQVAGKEIHFFDNNVNYERGYEWYRRSMPYSHPAQITIEKTPAYFINELVPERIFKMNESIKLLLIVRDPIQRTISDYTQVLFNRISRRKREKQFEMLAVDPISWRVNEHYTPIVRSIYHRHMERWLRFFPLSNIHIVSGERLITNPVSEIQDIERFLGLSSNITEDMFYFNRTRGFYCLAGSNNQPCLSRSKGRKHPQIRRRVINILKRFFRIHNEVFFKQVGRQFPW